MYVYGWILTLYEKSLDVWGSLNSCACFAKSCVKLYILHTARPLAACSRIVYAPQLMELDCVMPFPRRLLYIRLCCKTLILETAINHLD